MHHNPTRFAALGSLLQEEKRTTFLDLSLSGASLSLTKASRMFERQNVTFFVHVDYWTFHD